MERFARYVAVEFGVAGLLGLAVVGLALPAGVWPAALGGLALALGCGVWALWLKGLRTPATQSGSASAQPNGGPAELRRLLTSQGLTFGLRLAAALFGAVVARRLQLDAVACVAGFALLTLLLMAVEVRYVVGAYSRSRDHRAAVEVSR